MRIICHIIYLQNLGNEDGGVEMKSIDLATHEELTTLAELSYLGHYVLNNFKRRPNRNEKHEAMFLKIAELYKCETLKLYPEKAEELHFVDDYFIDRCTDFVREFEREGLPAMLVVKLRMFTDNYKDACEKLANLLTSPN